MVLVNFDLTDSEGKPIYTNVYITPTISPIAYSGSVVDSSTITLFDRGGNVSASLVPNTYDIRLGGFNGNTQFLISIPSGSDGNTINAADYIVNSSPSPNYSASYAQFAGTASFAYTASYALSTNLTAVDYPTFFDDDLNFWINYPNNQRPAFNIFGNTTADTGSQYGLFTVQSINNGTCQVGINLGNTIPQNGYSLDVNGNALFQNIAATQISASFCSLGHVTASLLTMQGQIFAGDINAADVILSGNLELGISSLITNANTDVKFDNDLDLILPTSGDTWNIYGETGLSFDPFLNVKNNGSGTCTVGINTATPNNGYALDVNGNIHCTTFYLDSGIQFQNLFTDAYGNVTIPSEDNNWNVLDGPTGNQIFEVAPNGDGSANIGISIGGPQYTLDVNGEIGNSQNGDFHFGVNGNNSWVNENGGSFGISTNAPEYTLDVNGNARIVAGLNVGGTITGASGDFSSVVITGTLEANNGYFVPITQAGSGSVSAATSKGVTFGHAFPSTNYSVVLNVSGSAPIACGYFAKATGGFSASFASSFTGVFNWQAISNTQ